MNENTEKKVSYITEDTVVKGDITTNSAIIVKGKVYGNLVSNDDAEIRGTIEGEIKANNINISGSDVTGNVSCNGNLFVDSESNVKGDITSNQVKLAGRVNGKVNVSKSVEILSSARIEGDIVADSIAIEHGATVKGYINIEHTEEKTVRPAVFETYKAPEKVEEKEADDFIEEL